jgi:hypothetical protein
MPSAAEILAQLGALAQSHRGIAIAWHVVLAVAVAALLAGWRPAARRAMRLLAVPVVSVGVLSAAHDGPFNAVVMLGLGASLLAVASRASAEHVRRVDGWPTVAGTAMVAFGALYPHFLEDGSLFSYLYAAPAGVLPCPTLALVTGFTLLGGGLRSRSWCSILGGAGVFYGAFGAAALGVDIDVLLFAGAVALLGATAFVSRDHALAGLARSGGASSAGSGAP